MLKGIPASPGIVIGKALKINNSIIEVPKRIISEAEVDNEKDKFLKALEIAEHDLGEIKKNAVQAMGEDQGAIFDAHILILHDEELITAVDNEISTNRHNAEFALEKIINEYCLIFENMDNEYMRERGSDIRDIGNRVLRIMLKLKNIDLKNLTGEYIIVSRDLTPSDTASINRSKVLAFITEIGGPTSHSAIMARSLEIPAIVGLGHQIDSIEDGDILIIDGKNGGIHVNPAPTLIEDYRNKSKQLHEDYIKLTCFKDLPSTSMDGKKVEIAANIGSPVDAHGALKNGAEGIGLFRTEFLYMNRSSLPSEEEQYEAYKSVLLDMKDKPVIIRTLDIGGDKKLPYLPISEELNPFLGYRAIRLCLDRVDIFKTQLRALLRASVYGQLRIMFPMISNLEELLEAKKLIKDVQEELEGSNISFSKAIEIGIMIEIPSAAIISDILATEVDFFSIGTNDLVQYTIAVDRMNERVAYLYNPYSPAVLRLIKLVIDNAHAKNKWVGMCGEAAGDTNLLPVLLGLGLDEFSMAPVSILSSRQLLSTLNFEHCQKLSLEVLKKTTSEGIKNCIQEFYINNKLTIH